VGTTASDKEPAPLLDKQLKYLLTSGIYPPDIGGPASFIPEFGAFLRESGAEVEVVTLASKSNEVSQEAFGKVIKVKRETMKLRRFIEVTWKIYKSSRNSEIIFANGLYEECAVASIFHKKKMVFKIVGDPIWERFRNSNRSSLDFGEYETLRLSRRLKLERIFFDWSLNRADVITCPGRKLAETIERNYGVRNIHVIENGINLAPSHEVLDFKYDVISVSRLVEWKRIDLLIRATARTGTSLIVIGDGPKKVELKRLAREIKADVHFFGSLPREQVLFYLQQSRIFALVSSYEGLSFSLLEALSVGKRILVSDIDANRSLFEGTEIAEIVNPEKPEQIDAAIKLLLNDSTQNRERERSGRELVSRTYNSRTQLKKMEKLALKTLEDK
jgi:glycosyltransferase involved in cell wall biosynthesis